MPPSPSHRKAEVRLPFSLSFMRVTKAQTYLPDILQVAIDVSGDGRLPLPPYSPNVETGLFNITLFLTSHTTGLNLTISNGTTAGWLNHSAEPPDFGCNNSSSQGFQNAGCQEVMLQESGSTVKHVNWVWPDCLVGDGGANDSDCGNGGGSIQNCLEGTARGSYNVCSHSLSDDYLTTHAPCSHLDLDPPVLPHERFSVLYHR